MNARRRARNDPLLLAEFREEARVKLLPALERLKLEPDVHALLLAYLGLDGRETLLSLLQLRTLPGLTKATHNTRFCRLVIFFLCNPAARRWLDGWSAAPE